MKLFNFIVDPTNFADDPNWPSLHGHVEVTNTMDFESDYEVPNSGKNMPKTPIKKRKRRRDQKLSDELVDSDTDEAVEASSSNKRLTAEDEDIQQDSVMGGHASGTIFRLLGETPIEGSAEAARDRDDTLFRQVERLLGFEGQLEGEDTDRLFLVGRVFGLGLDANAPASGRLEGGQKKRRRQR